MTKKNKKRASLLEAEARMESFLKKVGYKGNNVSRVNSIPDYRVHSNTPRTSDIICSNGTKRDTLKYTGDEILGIVTTHKSNLMPIRKDNKEEAKEAAKMRR